MKVAMYYSNDDVRIEEMEKPKPGAGEILLKVMASGICGSDVMEWYRKSKAPIVLGHEVAGDVAEVGKGVKGIKVGTRVVVTHHVPCYDCRYCNDGNETMCVTLRGTKFYPGGFSEYVRVPELNVKNGTFLLPNKLSYEEGTFIEPLACVVRGQREAGVRKGQTVLVIGSGIAGLLHIQMARVNGAEKVVATDISEFKLLAAADNGADHAINAKVDIPKFLLKNNDMRLADVVIVCTGALSALSQALKSVEKGGTILFFAPSDPGVELPIRVDELWKNGIKVVTSYAAAKKDMVQAKDLIVAGKVKVKGMITHRLGMDKTGEGFKLAAAGGESIKVIIKPNE